MFLDSGSRIAVTTSDQIANSKRISSSLLERSSSLLSREAKHKSILSRLNHDLQSSQPHTINLGELQKRIYVHSTTSIGWKWALVCFGIIILAIIIRMVFYFHKRSQARREAYEEDNASTYVYNSTPLARVDSFLHQGPTNTNTNPGPRDLSPKPQPPSKKTAGSFFKWPKHQQSIHDQEPPSYSHEYESLVERPAPAMMGIYASSDGQQELDPRMVPPPLKIPSRANSISVVSKTNLASPSPANKTTATTTAAALRRRINVRLSQLSTLQPISTFLDLGNTHESTSPNNNPKSTTTGLPTNTNSSTNESSFKCLNIRPYDWKRDAKPNTPISWSPPSSTSSLQKPLLPWLSLPKPKRQNSIASVKNFKVFFPWPREETSVIGEKKGVMGMGKKGDFIVHGVKKDVGWKGQKGGKTPMAELSGAEFRGGSGGRGVDEIPAYLLKRPREMPVPGYKWDQEAEGEVVEEPVYELDSEWTPRSSGEVVPLPSVVVPSRCFELEG